MMTTDFGHTKGDWSIRKTANDLLFGAHWRDIVSHDERGDVVIGEIFEGDVGVEQAEANAHLIVAASDMCKALIGLTPILATAESNASGNPEWEAVSAKINAARAAIAKATGK